MITGLAHIAICVPDVDAAVDWYTNVLGLRLLSPPYEMTGDAITRDMGELVPPPVVVRAAIVGVDAADHVLELVEYPNVTAEVTRRSITTPGITHFGVVCDDVDAERSRLEAEGVEFLTAAIADVAGLRTTWLRDPFGVVVILMEKTRDVTKPYWGQYG